MRRNTLTLTFASLFLLSACDNASKERGFAVNADRPTEGASSPVRQSLPMAADSAASPMAKVAFPSVSRREVTGNAMGERLAVATAAPPLEAPAPAPQEAVPGSMLIRTGEASVQVDSLEIGIARVRDIARRVGAVVANTSMQGGKNELRQASIELRIPSERFDDAINGLTPLGKVESVNVNVADVGEEYVDITARAANAKRLEQRLVDLLATRTGKLADVLGVERELARVRQEIERYEGRMRYLRTRASISTLTVSVHEPPPLVAQNPGESPIRDAFKAAWRNFVLLVSGAIALTGIIVPVGLLAIGAALLWRRYGPSFKSAGAGSA